MVPCPQVPPQGSQAPVSSEPTVQVSGHSADVPRRQAVGEMPSAID